MTVEELQARVAELGPVEGPGYADRFFTEGLDRLQRDHRRMVARMELIDAVLKRLDEWARVDTRQGLASDDKAFEAIRARHGTSGHFT